MALAAGVPMKVISNRLRHSSPNFTAKFYGDVLPELSHAAAEATAALVPDARTAAPGLHSRVQRQRIPLELVRPPNMTATLSTVRPRECQG
jgi:hypothetical protein